MRCVNHHRGEETILDYYLVVFGTSLMVQHQSNKVRHCHLYLIRFESGQNCCCRRQCCPRRDFKKNFSLYVYGERVDLTV